MSIEEPVDLYEIYRLVKQRNKKDRIANKSESTLLKIESMVKAAKDITEKHTLKNVAVFRKAEWSWFNSYDVKNDVVLYADEFENAIRSKNFVISKPPMNTLSCGWNPNSGIVYCFVSTSKPGEVKIGATTMELMARIKKLAKRYNYENVEVFFYQAVNYPSRVEEDVKRLLGSKIVSGYSKTGSIEWYKVSRRGAINAVKQAIQLNG